MDKIKLHVEMFNIPFKRPNPVKIGGIQVDTYI